MLEAELFSLLEHTSDAAFAVTETGEICFWSKSAERLFGYRAPEAVGQRCTELLDGHGVLGTQVCLEPTLPADSEQDGEIRDFDLRVRTASAKQVWVNVSTILFEEPRRNRRLIVHLARDISHRKRNEELLAKMLELAQEALSGSRGEEGRAPVVPLSEQEKRILRLFSAGNNSAEIARELDITLTTLRNHLHRINEKLRTHNRLEAVMNAIHRGLI
jgi:PAS domain S-box-containing protein